jgi:hypothetical protein
MRVLTEIVAAAAESAVEDCGYARVIATRPFRGRLRRHCEHFLVVFGTARKQRIGVNALPMGDHATEALGPQSLPLDLELLLG